jgi:hypothetical protein
VTDESEPTFDADDEKALLAELRENLAELAFSEHMLEPELCERIAREIRQKDGVPITADAVFKIRRAYGIPPKSGGPIELDGEDES